MHIAKQINIAELPRIFRIIQAMDIFNSQWHNALLRPIQNVTDFI